MENIQDLRITPISARPASKYYHPIRIEKIQNGVKSTRETGYHYAAFAFLKFC